MNEGFASQSEADAAYEQIVNGYIQLIKEADRSDLTQWITLAESLSADRYTVRSWNGMIEALAAAKQIAADGNASPAQIETAARHLSDAIDALQIRASEAALDALQNVLTKAEAVQDDSLKELIENAKMLLIDPQNVDSITVVTALLDLSEAMQALNTDESADALRKDVQATINFINENILNNVEGLRPGKVQALRDAAKAAQDIVNDPNATADELKAANKAMTKAAQELWEIVSKAELNTLIEAANGYLDGDYTAESLEVLQAAITAAQTVAANDDATTAEVTQAITDLSDAIANLEKITLDTSALEHEIELVNEMLANLDDYIASSVEGLADKLVDVQNVLENATSQTEIDEAVKTLREACLNARTKADVSALEYTTESAQALIQNLARAEHLITDPEITQEEVNDMVETLQVSVDELVEADDSTNAEDTTNTAAVNTTNAMFALMTAAGAAAAVIRRSRRA